MWPCVHGGGGGHGCQERHGAGRGPGVRGLLGPGLDSDGREDCACLSFSPFVATLSKLNLSGNPAIGQEGFSKSVSIREEAATGIDITKGVYGG